MANKSEAVKVGILTGIPTIHIFTCIICDFIGNIDHINWILINSKLFKRVELMRLQWPFSHKNKKLSKIKRHKFSRSNSTMTMSTTMYLL